MKLELTKEEMKHLTELLYIAEDLVFDAMPTSDEKLEYYLRLITKILKLAYENNLTDYIEKQSVGDYIFKCDAKELKDLDELIDNFYSYNYWERLISDLSFRDLFTKMTRQEFEKLDQESQDNLVMQAREAYFLEFRKHGTENLRLLKPGFPI